MRATIEANAQAGSVVALAPPGANIPLGGTNEVTIAVDPNDPSHVVAASLFSIRVSVDGGLTFLPEVWAPLPPTHGNCGDSSVGFDSQGRLFWTYLGCVPSPFEVVDVFVAQCDPNTGAVLQGYPINIISQSGGRGDYNDKAWLAVDQNENSPFRDRLYVAWTDVSFSVARVYTAFSSNQGLTWSPRLRLSTSADSWPWPTHNAVAPNGDAYVTFHTPTPNGSTGRVYLCRSTDGGVSYPQKTLAFVPGSADVTFNVQSGNAIPQTAFWLMGAAQGWVLADPNTPGRIYVVAADDPDNNYLAGDASNVYIATSTDYGVTFGAPVRIDDGPGTTFQVMPTAGIDPHTGEIVAHWYDNRRGVLNSSGNFLLDVYASYSSDGGVTWSPGIRLNDVPFDPDIGAGCRWDCGGPTPSLRIGEYNGVAVADHTGFAVWCGNTPWGSQQMIFDRFSLDSNAPVIVSCPPDTVVECGTPKSGLGDWLAGFTATDDLDASVTLSNDAPDLFLDGATTVTFTATDDAGNASTCSAIVTVVDTTPPTIDVVMDRNVLWPPDHQLVEVCATVTVTDRCDAHAAFTLESITSSEVGNSKSSGGASDDIKYAEVGTPDLCYKLRSERRGDGDGRTYVIAYRATDGSGNSADDTVRVRVPHDESAIAAAGPASEEQRLSGDAESPAAPMTAAQLPRETRLTSIHPNPFNPETTVEFALSSSQPVRIAIYDVRGSQVKHLVDQTMPAGEHRATWNGIDDAGRPASSGIYFVRMIAGRYEQTRKIVLLK
jgi:FlgD Ig-like domain/HYR domain